ncbi:MAG: hypothetical protein WAK11_12405 [Candidatus Cybelea sp.]
MKLSDMGRLVTLMTTVTLAFTGCGGTTVPLGAMTQSQAHQASGKSWMRPGASSGDLIYATGGCGGTCVLSYPDGQIVGSISTTGEGPCSDAAGNVFIPDGSQIFEYQHGGTTPIGTLTIPESNITTYNCSVDPTTNNLAISYLGETCICVAIFNNEGGTPTSYSTGIDSFFCGYDNAGNLFVDGLGTDQNPGIELSELARGNSTFTPLTVSGKFRGQPGRLQWDGTNLTYEGLDAPGTHAAIIKLAISGSVATAVKTIRLNGNMRGTTLSWIYDGNVLTPYSIHSQRTNKVGIWAYPKGGKRRATLKFPNSRFWIFTGVTVSVAT